MHEQATEGVGRAEQPAPEGRRAPGWGWGDVLLALLVTAGGGAAVALAARAAVGALGLQVEQRLVSPALYAAGMGIYLAAILGVYLFAARKAGWESLGVRPTAWRNVLIVPPLFVVGIILLALVNAGVGALAGGFENPQVDSLTGGQVLGTGELVALLLLVAVAAPLAEELLFRGMVYPLLRARLGAAAAIMINAAIFSAAHVVPLLLPGLFVVGLLLAYLRERSGSIWPPVLFHAMQNATALLLINAALAAGAM